ncbi:MAG TPA: putative lipid II flippase FtsW [Myxococcaceae bacterium]|nr:putative lipid II flippase FtsW [Myxococcaceae bacterium]
MPDGRSEPVRLAVDPVLLGAVLALVSLGLVMVYSASAVTAAEKQGNGFYFLQRQLLAAGVGLVVMATAVRVGYRRLARLAFPMLLLSIVLLVLVLVPGVGTVVGGARRWLRLPGLSLQPAEIAKFTWVVYLAYSLAKKREKVATFSIGFLPHLLLAGLLVALCMAEPDFGSSVELLVLLFILLFAAGTRLSYLVGSVLLALPLAYGAIAHSPYRLRRFTAFLDPWAHRHDIGYQVAQSLISVGSGGLFGLGLGESRQKLFFLPEAHTDFIFSIIGEELGLLGAVATIVLYGIVVWRGTRAALRASETFGTYLGLGLTAMLGVQAAVNMSVAMGMLPTKGLTLPFVSYGGCSLVISMAAAGVLLSLSASSAPLRNPGPSRVRRVQEALA